MLLQHVDEDDEMSEMSSGLAASTVESRHHEQDLAGFPEVERSHASAVPLASDAAVSQQAGLAGAVHPPANLPVKDSDGQVNASGSADSIVVPGSNLSHTEAAQFASWTDAKLRLLSLLSSLCSSQHLQLARWSQ